MDEMKVLVLLKFLKIFWGVNEYWYFNLNPSLVSSTLIVKKNKLKLKYDRFLLGLLYGSFEMVGAGMKGYNKTSK